jgi:hypothetical protein
MLYQSHEPSRHPSLQRSFTREQSNSGLPVRRLTLLCILQSHCDSACCESVIGGVNFSLKKGKKSYKIRKMRTYEWRVTRGTWYNHLHSRYGKANHHCTPNNAQFHDLHIFIIYLITTCNVTNYYITQILLHQMTTLICGTFVTFSWTDWGKP